MKNILKNNKGITIISLVVTIVILIIIASIAINALTGQEGTIKRTKETIKEQKRVEYFEDIKIEILEEQKDRNVEDKDDAFITSLKDRLEAKEWVERAEMYNTTSEDISDEFANDVLIVETTDDYELIIDVDNSKNTAQIRKDSFKEKTSPATITYEANGGTGSVANQVRKIGFNVRLKENGFTKKDYKFAGWCKDPKGNSDIYAAGTEITVEGDTTLYAIWSLDIVYITYDSNGGSGEMEDTPTIVNTPIQISSYSFNAPEGYKFNYWTTNQDGSGDKYDNIATITTDRNMTLYAQWIEAVSPTVTISMANSSDYLFAIKSTVKITDASGVDFSNCKYVYTTSKNNIGENEELYTDGSISTENTTIEKVKGAGTYYLHILATDKNGNVGEKVSDTSITVASVANYDFVTPNGGEQTANILPGLYQLEVWGAQGGGSRCNGSFSANNSYGGYSKGYIKLNQSKKLYIVVGGAGTNAVVGKDSSGGYNGGGSGSWDGSDDETAGGGGGATHIAINNNRGVLSNYDKYRNEILIVAGGSGGKSWQTDSGVGGGLQAGKGGAQNAATQDSGYSFGKGQNGSGGGAGSDGVGGGGRRMVWRLCWNHQQRRNTGFGRRRLWIHRRSA